MSLEQKNQVIRECTEDHISPVELARKHNVSADTIRAWIRRAGLTQPKTYRRAADSLPSNAVVRATASSG